MKESPQKLDFVCVIKTLAEHISFEHTKALLGGSISVVFYDMATLYFESSDGDDLARRDFQRTESIGVLRSC